MRRRSTHKWIPPKLPRCDGPKLGQFLHHNSRIQWLERLDTDADRQLSTQGFIFRAIIEGKEYAIKVFKFFDPVSTEYFWGPLMGEDTPLDTAAFYTDPFYAECRAYGRIHEAVKRKKLNVDAAVPCHGYLFLQAKDQKFLHDQKVDLGLGMVNLDYQRATFGGCKPRAIVKDIASWDTGVNSNSLGKLLRNLTKLNKQGVYNMDIRRDNYRDGKIVDFGSSWTEPHSLLDACNGRQAYASRVADRAMFDQMVRDENIANPRAVKAVHMMKRRSQNIK